MKKTCAYTLLNNVHTLPEINNTHCKKRISFTIMSFGAALYIYYIHTVDAECVIKKNKKEKFSDHKICYTV